MSEIERAREGVRNLVNDYHKVAKERDKHPEIHKIVGDGQKFSWRVVNIIRVVIMVGLAVGTIYVVLWVLTHLMPW